MAKQPAVSQTCLSTFWECRLHQTIGRNAYVQAAKKLTLPKRCPKTWTLTENWEQRSARKCLSKMFTNSCYSKRTSCPGFRSSNRTLRSLGRLRWSSKKPATEPSSWSCSAKKPTSSAALNRNCLQSEISLAKTHQNLLQVLEDTSFNLGTKQMLSSHTPICHLNSLENQKPEASSSAFRSGSRKRGTGSRASKVSAASRTPFTNLEQLPL